MLVHYYNKDFASLKSISATTNVTEIVGLLSEQECKAFNRFKNYEWYIAQRIGTEKWLHDVFFNQGGRPKIFTPIYFVLGNSEYLKMCYGENVGIIEIPLRDIDEEDISFTLSDSVSIHVSGENKLVLTKKTLIKYVSEQNNSLFDYIKQLDEQHCYIEAQIWNDSYFAK